MKLMANKTLSKMVKQDKKHNKKGGKMKKGNFHRGNNAKAAKGSKAKPPPPPPEKYLSWWQTMKSQLHFIMTGRGKSPAMIMDQETIIALESVINNEELEDKKSIVRSLWRKLTPTLMKYTPQLFNIKRAKSSEQNVQDWLEAMPEPEKCKTDDTVDALWWPTTEEKVTEIITEAPSQTAFVPRKERKPTSQVDPLVKMYSNTSQLVPYKECSRSLVDLRTLETKRKNRQQPKNRFSKNSKNTKKPGGAPTKVKNNITT